MVVVAVVIVGVALLGRPGLAVASPASGGSVVLDSPAPALELLSQTSWVTAAPGQVFDLHLRATSTSLPASQLGFAVSVFPCLSSVSAFDQSVGSGPTGTPVSSTTTPVALGGLPTVAGGGVDLSIPVEVGGTGSGAGSATSPFTIHLRPVTGQCQLFPAGVYPMRVQLVDTSSGSVLGSITTHLVYTEAAATTQRLRVAVVIPVQTTQRAARAPSPAALLARPTSALTAPTAAVSGVAGTVAVIDSPAHQTVPLTLQVSGQTVGLVAGGPHASAVAQLGQLAASPDVHQLTAAPFAPVDAAALVGAGLTSELAQQVARGTQAGAEATGRPVPAAAGGLWPCITGDPLDTTTGAALVGDG